ncbi:energy transducer TonB [Emticicia sp. TH156]|uniref:energy transducer TonB n=1 Tax=Emticicia sp. TH156 TaxID=2067454 RepID=UPI000C779337|nr:energy transducer TonB [Emticicia sp. TH156]PLK43525.1 energy transducer TonB [Emticicia sp. TH156]
MATIASPATLDEIVFEHRNKDYGAYELRKTYTLTVNRAMWIGITLFSGLFVTSYIFARQKDKVKDQKEVIINLQDLKEPEQPPVEQIPEPEPPKPIEQVQTIKYLVPEVVENPVVEEAPPTQDEMEKAVISNVTTPGEETESIAETPPAVAPPVETKIAEVVEDNTPFLHVEVQPSFVGGSGEMYKFLGKTLKYPSAAQRSGVEGKVFLSFIVERDGSITDVKVAKSVGFGCDEEAIRAVKLMPKWIPGKQNGRNVRVNYTIPVIFKLE